MVMAMVIVTTPQPCQNLDPSLTLLLLLRCTVPVIVRLPMKRIENPHVQVRETGPPAGCGNKSAGFAMTENRVEEAPMDSKVPQGSILCRL